jgi:hypothetical protein
LLKDFKKIFQMETPQPKVDLVQLTNRVIAYYYSYGTEQQLNTRALPSIPDIRNLVPALVREWYNFEGGKNWYGFAGQMLEVMDTLDSCQQKKYFNDYLFKYVIDRIDTWNRPPTDNHHEDRFLIYSSGRFGGPQNPESRRPFNPVAFLGTRDNRIQIPYIMITKRNYETDITETLNDSLELGTVVYKNDLSHLLGRKNY